MRSLLELLGMAEPDAARREPVTLPSWSRFLVPLLVCALAAASMFVYSLTRLLVA